MPAQRPPLTSEPDLPAASGSPRAGSPGGDDPEPGARLEAWDRAPDLSVPTPRTGGARWGDRIAALAEVTLCSGFPTQFTLGLALAAAGLRPFEADGSLSASYLVILSLADSLLVVGLVVVFLRAGGERVGAVLTGPRPVGGEALLGLPLTLLVGVLVVGTLGLIGATAPWLHNVAENPLARLIGGPLGAVGFGLVALVAGAVREEIQRAFVLHRFREHLGGGLVGLVLFSALFGAGHALQGWDVAVATALMGAVWGLVYLARQSLVAPLVSHALFNLTEVFRYTLGGS